MAFTIKNFESITASLILRVAETSLALTDFNVGSKVRTLLEAYAQELEYFYLEMFRGILEGIDSAIYNSFDFPALPAVAASGQVTFSLFVSGTTTPLAPTANITITTGTRVQIPVQTTSGIINNSAPVGTVYKVANDTVWLAGQTTASATVVCDTAGTIGNTTANSVSGIVDRIAVVQNGAFTVNNPVPFVNGQNEETPTQHRARFSKYLQSLGRGTKTALQYAVLQAAVTDSTSGALIEQVKKAVVVEPYLLDGSKPAAHADIYIHNGVGRTSADLVTNAQKIIDGYTDSNNNRISGYKSAGIIASVIATTENPIAFVIRVTMLPGFSLTSSVSSQISGAIAAYVSSLNPGEKLVYNKIIDLVMATAGVYNCVVTSPVGDVVLANASIINTIASISITETTAGLTVTSSETFTTP
jgi:hypothetical protein